ncbi:adhesion G protein-coupled receptor E3-like [Alligator mississippiensis]|uniref:adhesion G protein-coupled receptor E3-like n=1 Tax=Alligator mississippiensis TaxID=8496 RepID=UPI0028775C63|nr:adhesion G protein-coupled receptor E3-like [Alligator mississippiensis]
MGSSKAIVALAALGGFYNMPDYDASESFEKLFSATSELHKDDQAVAATVLLAKMESFIVRAALQNPQNLSQNFMSPTMDVAVQLITNGCLERKTIKLKVKEDTMSIDCQMVVGAITPGSGVVAFIEYTALESLLGSTDKSEIMVDDNIDDIRLNSAVVSGTVGKPRNLSKPFNFILKHKQNSYTMIMLTYVGLSISLLCLFLAILTFLLCRSLWSITTAIHLQLCICLFVAELIFLTMVHHFTNKTVCAIITGFLHYFFLAAFTWMFLEGLHLILTVRNLKVVNYTSARKFKKRYMYPFGYGLPASIVAISVAANPAGYGTSEHLFSPRSCWLSEQGGFIWCFIGPVCFIILVNLIFFLTTLWILRDKLSSLNTDVTTIKDTRLLTFKAIAQLFILGCTWSLGLFQTKQVGVMEYLFTISSSLQGAFIFLVHCVLNRQVREQYKRWFRRTGIVGNKSQPYELSTSMTPITISMEHKKSSGKSEENCVWEK